MKKKKNILLRFANKWLTFINSKWFLTTMCTICVFFTIAFCIGAFLHFSFYKSTMYEIVIISYLAFAAIICIFSIITFCVVLYLYLTWEEEEW